MSKKSAVTGRTLKEGTTHWEQAERNGRRKPGAAGETNHARDTRVS